VTEFSNEIIAVVGSMLYSKRLRWRMWKNV